MKKKYLLLFLLSVFSFTNWAQSNSDQAITFSIEELQEDFNFWRNRLIKTSPVLYLYNSRESFNAYFDSLYKRIDHPMSQVEFFGLIAPTTGYLKDGHTQIHESKAQGEFIVGHAHIIPIDVEWFEDSAYVSFNFTQSEELKIGTRIISINTVPIQDIYTKVLELLPRDGYSEAYPKYWVNRSFWYYYHLLYGMHASYDIEVSNIENKQLHLTENGLSLDSMDLIKDALPTSKPAKKDGINLEIIDSTSTAILSITTFSSSSIKKWQKSSFKKIINSKFDELQDAGVHSLIIDIRGNDGGNPKNVVTTLARIFHEPFEFKIELRRIKRKEEELLYKRTGKSRFSDGALGTFKPHKTPFQGKVIVLVDGGATSAGGEFVSLFQKYERGVILGTESGGSPVVLSGWWINFIKFLPNTKLKTVCGQKCSILRDLKENSGRGLIPDQIIEPSIDDFMINYDRCLHVAIEMVKK